MKTELRETLLHEILQARQRVYRLHKPTPLDRHELPDGTQLYLKREDMGPIRAYKWRGAYNTISQMTDAEKRAGVVTASAGNHAQGVALAARTCGTTARIFMPGTTPMTKQRAVARFGGDAAEIRLVGDTFGDAMKAALADADKSGRMYLSAYDNPKVMGGQGTIADEIVLSGEGPFDVAYLQIGGGGMAGAVSFWLKENYPEIHIIGVEGEGQASYHKAIEAGHPVMMDKIDVFCDGTAIPRVGDWTYPVLRSCIDEVMTVSNDEVCAAIEDLWGLCRCIPEPAGAMGYAGFAKHHGRWNGKKVLCIICGANIDFSKLAMIANRAPFGAPSRRYLRVQIGEEQGQLLKLLERYFEGINIVDYQYGQRHPEQAYHTVGFEADDQVYASMLNAMSADDLPHEDVAGRTDVRFRVIAYRSELFAFPLFARLEFNDRPGALLEILQTVSPHARLCYFNYLYTGENVGRALIGFDFKTEAAKEEFLDTMQKARGVFHDFQPLTHETLQRML